MKPLYINTGTDEKGQSPLCPYCDKELSAIRDHRSHLKFLSNMHVFCCPYCSKVLGVTAVNK